MNTTLQLSLSSFGFKYGLPEEATLVWDVRFLPNPYWVEEMRSKTGLDSDVAAYVLTSTSAIEFFRLIEPLLRFLVEEQCAAGKREIRLAIGCTGGQHRSVAVVERLKELLAPQVADIAVRHRDIHKGESVPPVAVLT